MPAKKGLGAGLNALFGETAGAEEISSLPISRVEPREAQPRISFDEASLNELAESIREYGLIQPITVRSLDNGYYQIIAGERRWRAARLAGLREVPVRVIEADDRLTMELALVENLQREDLNPLEEAGGYQALMEEYGFTQEDVARTVGRSRPAVANALRLLALPEDLRALVQEGKLSAGHARALLAFPDEEGMRRAARLAVEQGLSVRQLEKMAQAARGETAEGKPKKEKRRLPYYDEVELALHEHLGRRVSVKGSQKKGTLQIEFYGQEDLAELLKLFGDD